MFEETSEREVHVGPGSPPPAPPSVLTVGPPGVSPAVARLVAATSEVLAQVPSDLAEPCALADARELMVQLDVLRAALLGRLADVETRRLHALDGASSTSAWVHAQGTATSREEVALARRLHRLPYLHQQVVDGRLPVAAAQAVGLALDKARPHVDRPDGRIDGHPGELVLAHLIVDGVLQLVCEGVGGMADDDPELPALVERLVAIAAQPVGQLARLEQAFVLLAQHLPALLLRAGLDRLLDALLPQQLRDRVEAAHQRRGLRLRLNADGSGYTLARADLSLECGELLAAVLTAVRTVDPDNPADTAAWRLLRQAADGATATGSSDRGTSDAGTSAGGSSASAGAGRLPGPAPRSRAQQDHDALHLALRRLLDSGALGSRGKTAPHLLVTVSAAALHHQPGALPALSTTGTHLPAGLVTTLLCDSRLTRAVLGLGHRVLEVSHTERTARPHERLVLALRWGGRCAELGCTSPPGTPLTPHHVEPWEKTGVTALADTVPICELTHQHVHTRGQTITLRDGRRLGPGGWISTTGSRAARPGERRRGR